MGFNLITDLGDIFSAYTFSKKVNNVSTLSCSSELSQDLNGNSQAAATRQKMAQLEQMLSALDQLRRVRLATPFSPEGCWGVTRAKSMY